MPTHLGGGFINEQEVENLRIEAAARRALQAMPTALAQQRAARNGGTPALSYNYTYDRDTGAQVNYLIIGDEVDGTKPLRRSG